MTTKPGFPDIWAADAWNKDAEPDTQFGAVIPVLMLADNGNIGVP